MVKILTKTEQQILKKVKNGMKVKELTKKLNIWSPGFYRSFHSLKDEGFFELKKDPEDKRTNIVYLTKKGKKLVDLIKNGD